MFYVIILNYIIIFNMKMACFGLGRANFFLIKKRGALLQDSSLFSLSYSAD
jgi:hypothetical protein